MLTIDHQQRKAATQQHEGNKMKYRLAESTMKKYNAQQLANHIDRVQDKFDYQLYRIDTAYNSIYELCDGSYHYSGTLNKDNLLEKLWSLYFAIKHGDHKACN